MATSLCEHNRHDNIERMWCVIFRKWSARVVQSTVAEVVTSSMCREDEGQGARQRADSGTTGNVWVWSM